MTIGSFTRWALVGAIGFSGCYTHVSMKKVAPGSNVRGQRVRLPAPFLVGRPDASQKVTYGIEYLPDPDQEYAIDAWTLFAKLDVSIKRKDMMLTGITVDEDNAAVAAQLAGSAGAVGEAVVDRMNTVRQQQEAAEAASRAETKAAIKEKEDKLNAAKDAVFDAESDLREAQAQVAARTAAVNGLPVDADPAVKAAAAAALAEAKEEEAKMQRVLVKAREVEGRAESAFVNEGGHLSARKRGERIIVEQRHTQHPGPIIYRILPSERPPGFKLERVNFRVFSIDGKPLKGPASQVDFPTWGAPKSESAEDGNASGASASGGANRARAAKLGNIIGDRRFVVGLRPGTNRAVVRFDRLIVAFDKDNSSVTDVSGPAPTDVTRFVEVTKTDRDRLTLEVKEGMPAGKEYSVSLRVLLNDRTWGDFALRLKVL